MWVPAPASAVVADIVDLARSFDAPASARVNHLAFNNIDDVSVLPMEEVETAYYLRIEALDKAGVLANVASILSERGINIEAIIQKEPQDEDKMAQIILLTHRIVEKTMNEAIAEIEALASTVGQVTRIRVEHLNQL